MSLKVLLSTFALVFLAELGDKTQLTTMVLAAESGSPVSVFLGAGLALLATSLLGATVGAALPHVIPLRYIRLGAGLFFVVVGFFLVFNRG